VDRGHGRIDARTIKTLPPNEEILKKWPQVRQVFLVERYSYGTGGELLGAVAVLGIIGRGLSQAVPPAVLTDLGAQPGGVGRRPRAVLRSLRRRAGPGPAGRPGRAHRAAVVSTLVVSPLPASPLPSPLPGGARRPELLLEGLDPEHGAEHREQRPFEGVGPAQLVARLGPVSLPASARWSCQSPSHSIPAAATTANACQASHFGRSRHRQRDRGGDGGLSMGGTSWCGRRARRCYQRPTGTSAVTAMTANSRVR